MVGRLTIEFVRERTSVIAPKYTLLSKEYVNNRTPLLFRCPKGHTCSMRWNDFSRGSRCPTCARIAKGIAQRVTIERAREYADSSAPGYFVERVYMKGGVSWVDVRCPKGHTCSMRWNDFSRGSRCPTCANKARSIAKRITIERAREYADSSAPGYFVERVYMKGGVSWVDVRCPKGHTCSMRWDDFSSHGSRCRTCARIAKRITIERAREYADSSAPGYFVERVYMKGGVSWIDVRCQRGHTCSMRWNNFSSQGSRCPRCVNVFKREEACRSILEELTGRSFPSTRSIPWLTSPTTGNQLELDCYNEELKLALEHHGIQHYQPATGRWAREDAFELRRAYDKHKLRCCIRQSVLLIVVPYTIPEDQLRAFIEPHVTRWLRD